MPARLRFRFLLLLLPLVVLAGPARAAVPSTLGYQGLLTDGGGSPVPNGAYDLAFAIYDVPSGGVPLWTESHPAVGVVNGSFAVTLGSVNALTSVAFDRPYWLGISVGAAPELAPRVELAASPYALGWRAPFAATTNGVTPTLRLSNDSGWPSLQVDGWLQVKEALGYGGLADVNAPDGVRALQMWGGDGPGGGGFASFVTIGPGTTIPASIGQDGNGDGSTGYLSIRGGGGNRFAYLSGWNLGTGNPRLDLYGNGSSFIVNTNNSGDAAVALPLNSVGPDEMKGVPGISHTATGLVTIGSTMGPVVSTTITTPVDGYVRVTAGGEVRLNGTAGANTVTYQISTNPTAAEDVAVSRGVGAHQYVSTVFQFFTANAERIYFLAPGTYTFYFQARRDAAAGGAAGIKNPSITAAFFPVSYGSVVSMMETGEATDLRDLELRATRMRLELERTEREIEIARHGESQAAFEERLHRANAARTKTAGSAR